MSRQNRKLVLLIALLTVAVVGWDAAIRHHVHPATTTPGPGRAGNWNYVILGDVKQPGQYGWPLNKSIRLRQAISSARGPVARDVVFVQLSRKMPDGHMELFKLDGASLLKSGVGDQQLLPEDFVQVRCAPQKTHP
jgi:hypothetical protein